MSAKPELIDSFGRRIEYLRVSVIERCNYRCLYCMPRAGARFAAPGDLLTDAELARLVRLFTELGVHRVRLTGGEPLVRKGIVDLARLIGGTLGIADLSLSTNGHLLERHVAALKAAGVARVNISLDSLDPETFARITRGGDLGQVLRGVEAALTAGMTPVKLNMVVLKGTNDHEIEPMLDFALARGVHLRFIETMPVGEAGIRGMEHYYPADAILARVRKKAGVELIPIKGAPGAGPARCYRIGNTSATVGIVSAISRHFCEGCNRVRLTAAGDLVLCLGRRDRVALRPALRDGSDDETLKATIRAAVTRKPERHDFLAAPAATGEMPMSALGG